MNESSNNNSALDHISPEVLDLLLNVILEVMQAEQGSIMLLDERHSELTIRSSKGLKKKIVEQTRVRLGSGISGKVAETGESVFLKGIDIDRRVNLEKIKIKPEEFTNPEIESSCIIPIQYQDKILGTININSNHPDNSIILEKYSLVKEILNNFLEHIIHTALPISHHAPPSQLYMMNIFREYNTLRELRIVFDYIFKLVSAVLQTESKGFFILNNADTGFFDLVLGYGLDTQQYAEVYTNIVPKLKDSRIESARKITIFNRKDFPLLPETFFSEDFFILLPLIKKDDTKGQILLFTSHRPILDNQMNQIIKEICEIAAITIEKSIPAGILHDLTFTDRLTGTYNYGLWWRRLHEEFDRAKRIKDTRIILIVFDVDHFNRFNLDHGYFIGDQLLRLIADRMIRCVRSIDIVGRIGEDEFGVILTGNPKDKGLEIGNRILKAISGIPTEMKIDLLNPLTLSGGISIFPDNTNTPEGIMDKAKTALISAKIMGGNQIKIYEDEE